MTYKVYLAGPITGVSYEGTMDWRIKVGNDIRSATADIVTVNPMRGKEYLRREVSIEDSYEQVLLSSQRGIFTRDMNDCRRCDALFVNILGATAVSIGTIMEITSFWEQRKPIVLVMEDKGNIHNHAMIREAVPFRVNSLRKGVQILQEIILP